MGEPIISPWVFYLGDIVFSLNVLTILGVIVCIPLFLAVQRDLENLNKCGLLDDDEQEAKLNKFMKFRKLICIAFCVFLFGCIFIPTKTTYYQMVVAHYVTYENLDKVKELTKDSINYILDKIIETAKKAR